MDSNLPLVSNSLRLTRRWTSLITWSRLAFLAGIIAAVLPAHAQTFLAEWSTDAIGRFGPTSLAIDKVGNTTYLYVTDDPYGRIIKFDASSGARIAAFGQNGNGPMQFNSPYGVAVDPVSHDLYIAERGNHRIQRITNTGQFVMGWGSLGTGPGQFDSPIGVVADANGNVYVVDHQNNRVEKFRVTQTSGGWNVDLVTMWGGFGAANGQFNGPYGIALDPQGDVWVADARNHRLQKFDATGRFLLAVGTNGSGDGQFITPVAVSFDASGNYYVAETNSDPTNLAASDLQNQRIQKFSATNTYQMKWGSYGEGGGQFKLPFAVVVDNLGNAFVADYYNTRVQKFSLNPPPTGGGGGGGSGGQFGNLSSRLRTNEGAGRELIAGFVIAGTTAKQVLIRGVGPTLTQYGVTNPLADPKLQVRTGQTLVIENEDWGGNPAVASAAGGLGAFPLDAASKDAAVLVTLNPGNYTAQVAPNAGDGVAIVEVYDADHSTTARLSNLSTRGFVDTGDGVLVAGFYVGGNTPKRVLIRGIGPGLEQFGVTGVVANPVLEVYASGNVLVAQNDNWGTPLAVAGQAGATPATGAEIASTASGAGAFSFSAGSTDAAVVLTLEPGTYSAVVKGAGGTTGAGMVEVYELSN